VALLGPAHPLRGGISQYLALLHRALEPHAEVVQFSLLRQYPGFVRSRAQQRDESEEPLSVPDVPVLDMLAPWSWPAAGRRVAAWHPHGVVFKWWLPYFGAAYACVLRQPRRAGAAAIMIADNLVPHERRPLDTTLTRLVLRHTDAFLVMSQAVEADLKRLVPGALYRHVAHPPYLQYGSRESRAESRAALGLDSDVILFFGFVRPYKGLDTLLEAMPAILAERNVTLVVAGEFQEPIVRYRALVERLGVASRVRLIARYLRDEEVRRLLAAVDVCVLPYRSATQSGVIQAAYAAGCPVIATRVGGLPEFIVEGESGYTVPPERPAALARAVLEFYRAGGRPALEPGVRRQAARGSWEALAQAALELIQQVRSRRSFMPCRRAR
jgi:glycosyltransferase involved in cell wall biosynthesis